MKQLFSTVSMLTAAMLAVLWTAPALAQAAGETVDLPVRAVRPGDPAATVTFGEDLSPDEARRLLDRHQRQLEQVERQEAGVAREVTDLERENIRLRTRLVQTGLAVRHSEQRMATLEAGLDRLKAEEAVIRVDLGKQHKTIAQMLAVMQRMGRHPPPVMVTQRRDALKMVRSAMLLASFFPGFKEEADKLAAQLADLEAVMQRTRDRQQQLRDEHVELAGLRSEVTLLLGERRGQLKANQQKLEKLRLASLRHSQAVSDLGGLLAKLDAEVARQSELGAYEEQLRQGLVVELKPQTQTVSLVQPDRMQPAVAFDHAKGLLPLPAVGARVRDFGAADDYGSPSQGIQIETRDQAQVTAPCDGWVIYAGPFRSYGQLLIINAGGGYHVLLAGMDHIYTSVGQFVLAGEPVAAMGASRTADPSSAVPKLPVLYVEFRKDARPVDPDPWWSQGVEKG